MAGLNEWSATPGSNASVGSVNWTEGQNASTVNNSARQMMADVADVVQGTGAVYDTWTFCDPADTAKKFRFDGGSVSSGATVVVTIPNADLSFSTFATTLLDDSSAGAARTTLGLAIGTDVQAYQAAQDQATWEAGVGTTESVVSPAKVAAAIAALASAGISAASQAEMEAASSTAVAATPGRTQYHPGVAKAWVYITTSGGTVTVAASHNVSSVTDNGAGDFTTNFTTAFSSAAYAWVGMAQRDTGNTNNHEINTKGDTAPTTTAHRWQAIINTATLNDPPGACVAYFGDQ